MKQDLLCELSSSKLQQWSMGLVHWHRTDISAVLRVWSSRSTGSHYTRSLHGRLQAAAGRSRGNGATTLPYTRVASNNHHFPRHARIFNNYLEHSQTAVRARVHCLAFGSCIVNAKLQSPHAWKLKKKSEIWKQTETWLKLESLIREVTALHLLYLLSVYSLYYLQIWSIYSAVNLENFWRSELL